MDGLSFRRVAGGSVIDCPPVFSENGDILFTIVTKVDLTALSTYCADRWVGSVSAYSTKTAECIYELELPSKVVNIERMPGSSTMMVGCTEAGQIFTWKSKSSKIETTTEMFPELSVSVKTFNIVPFEDNYFALVTWTCVGGTVIQMDMFDLNGNNQQWKLIQLEEGEHKISVSRNDNKIIAAIQNHKLFVTKLVRRGDSKKSSIFTNAGRERFTVVACHPVEQTVAVGDVTGKIFIYRSLFQRSNNPPTTLFHWHHNGVNAIAFTSSGSIFYSGGTERVLLAWNYRDDGKNLRPQFNGAIVQIAVSPDNQQIAASTDDNGIVIVNTQLNPIKLIQNFVRVADEKTPWPLFPLGLNVDPCTGYIVMNGRIGEVQFYSPYDRTFFNLDVTEENRLSLESGKILYNTRITHVACNVDWLVTAECLDDLTRFPEVRLKFYLFDVTQKKFVLSTQIETPHENGVTALAFSSTQRVDNLLCASSGLDGTVKIWGLVENDDYIESPDSENGNRATTTRKYWVCQTKTTYKDLPVSSLAFMSDGSALGVGFGNTLCVYDAETLQLRAALSAPSGLDGSTNKVIVSNPKPLSNSQLMKVQKLAQRGEEIVRNFLENDDDQLINDLIKETEKLPQQNQNSQTADDDIDKKKLFQKLFAHNELNFYQDLELFQKMGIRIKVPDDSEYEFRRYVIMTMSVAVKEDHLKEQCAKLGPNKKFLGHWMLQNYLTRRREAAANGFHWENVIFGDDTLNSSRTSNGIESMEWENDQPSSTTADPVRNVSNIQRVLFGTGDSQLLAIVCTENRLLIWNLLTLRLQSSWKLTLRNISVDPSTGLVAINTFSDELYVLHPSKQYVLYQRKNMPKIHGMVWLPRREPRKSSLDVDWQSVSQLFFLSRDQELLYLVSDNDEDLFADRGVTLKQVDQFEPQTSFGAMVARQGTNDAASSAGQRNMAGGLIGEPTKMSVRELTDLQTHTMAPLRLLCYKFLTSVLTRQVVQSVDPSKSQNDDDDVDMEYDSETEESGQLNGTIPERLDSTVNVISQEDTERRNAVFNKLYNEKPKHNFTFMSPMVG